MAKMNDIRFLARETAKEVSGSPRDWMRYLDTAVPHGTGCGIWILLPGSTAILSLIHF